MTNRFLISVAAAALIAGTGLANAQGMGRDSGGSAGSPAAQQSAPSSDRGGASSGGAMQRDSGGASGMKGAESGMKNDSGMTKGEVRHEGRIRPTRSAPASKSAQDGQPHAGREVEEHELRAIRPRAARK